MVNFNMLIIITILLSSPFTTNAKTANEAWQKLLASKFKTKQAFAYVENNNTLPNILLYGDSISIHYTPYVRDSLRGKANVYRLYCNGGSSDTFIDKMDLMHKTMTNKELDNHWSFKWDVIHFNVGLHDLKYIKNNKLDKVNGNQVNSIEDYKKNLLNIIRYLKKSAPRAQLVFATTTPVPLNEPGRMQGDSVKYNIAALEVLQRFPDIKINDLYTITKPNQQNWWIKPADVHYAKNGRKAQGSHVTSVILKQLKL